MISKPIPEFEEIREIEKFVIKENKDLKKEVIFIKESDIPILNFYYKTLFPKIDSFIFHVGIGYKLISELEPNLLREDYWVIANHGIFGSLNPQFHEYNANVLDNYLNHIIVTNNFGHMECIDKENWTIPMKFGKTIYNYDVKFISSLGFKVYEDYIKSKLQYLYDWKDLDRIINYIYKDKRNRKNIIKLTELFAERHSYKLDITLNNIEKDYTYEINGLMRKLLLKEKDSNWNKVIANLLQEYNEHYINTVLKNNMELAYKLKFRITIPRKDEFKTKYMNTYIQNVDLLDIVYLYNLINKKEDFRIKYLKIKKYMETDIKVLITEYRGGL